jgi:uncharacterized protein YbjT (DUF2867 family)
VRALTDDAHEGRTYDLTGPRAMLPSEQVAVPAAVLGRDLRAVPLSDDETRAELEATTPPPHVDAFLRFYVDGTLDETTVHPDVTAVTTRPARTFEEWAAEHAEAFRAWTPGGGGNGQIHRPKFRSRAAPGPSRSARTRRSTPDSTSR